MVKSCGWILFMGPLYVFNYNIKIELWVMKTENSQNVFSVSITHNSKIRKLSDENKVMETKLLCAKRILSYGSHHFWVMSYGNWELSYGNKLSKQPLKFSVCFFFFSVFFSMVWIVTRIIHAHGFTMHETKCTVYLLFIDSTILFTYLKIILL